MTPDIALILGIDGIATGSIYVLVGLGLVLIFSVTRVVFVPFGDIVAFSALTLASLQLGRMPGTVYLVATLAVVACIVVTVHHWRRREPHRIGRGLIGYGILPLLPAAIVWFFAGASLPNWAQIPLAIALVVPIAPLIERIALRPLRGAPDRESGRPLRRALGSPGWAKASLPCWAVYQRTKNRVVAATLVSVASLPSQSSAARASSRAWPCR